MSLKSLGIPSSLDIPFGGGENDLPMAPKLNKSVTPIGCDAKP